MSNLEKHLSDEIEKSLNSLKGKVETLLQFSDPESTTELKEAPDSKVDLQTYRNICELRVLLNIYNLEFQNESYKNFERSYESILQDLERRIERIGLQN